MAEGDAGDDGGGRGRGMMAVMMETGAEMAITVAITIVMASVVMMAAVGQMPAMLVTMIGVNDGCACCHGGCVGGNGKNEVVTPMGVGCDGHGYDR